ncbi:MAG: copper amine oxidase N-terminal domain-containing protein [Thermoanaerobacteraceae bacterium]|nr:copper amine oxidase N-terminal domain-containing protein [Thermoanaerobacteraceae bacterium]
MLKTRKKWLSILLTVAMLVGLMVPVAGPAMAVGTVYTTLTAPTVEDDTDHAALGSFQIEMDPIYADQRSSAMIELPSDYEMYAVTVTGFAYGAYKGILIYNPDKVSSDVLNSYPESQYVRVKTTDAESQPIHLLTADNKPESGGVKVKVSAFTKRGFKLTLEAPDSSTGLKAAAGAKFRMQISYPDVKVPAGENGDVKVKITNIEGQLVDGQVVVAIVSGGALRVTVIDDESFSDAGGYVTIRVEETVAGELNAKDKLKLELPDGFEWGTIAEKSLIYGKFGSDGTLNDAVKFDQTDPDTLKIYLTDGKYETRERVAFDFKIKIDVTDTDEAETGDVKVKVKGDYDVSPTEIIVGQYGEYESTIKAEDPSIVAYAGQEDQDVSDIVIKESVKGSLVEGRTIKLTLPENARWWKIDDTELEKDENGKWKTTSKNFKVDEDNKVELWFVGLEGTDDRTAKFEIKGSSENASDPAELKIENISVALEAGVTGDLKVKVSGSAGLDEEITIAKVVNPVTVTAEKVNVQLGKFEQPAGKIVITEYAAEAIDTDNGKRGIELRLPDGVKFSSKPDVEVTKGDLEIEQVSLADDDSTLKIKLKDDSTEASTIEISNIFYDVDRTFGEGDVKVEVGGMALVTTDKLGYEDKDLYDSAVKGEAFFEDNDYVVKVANATCVTPAPAETRQTAVFTINSTTYTVNGVQATMDVAPYIKDGRTYLPVRYVAYALGISPENVIWDGVKATFIGQGRVVQVAPGSTILAINGAPVSMDVAAEVVNGRVMVPFRWVALAFGAQVDWDEANQTVTMKL